MNKYLIRLDDACPTMNAQKWQRMERILDKYTIRPLVGVIPKNTDSRMMIDPYDNNFWAKVISWKDKGWEIAMHGYEHNYITQAGLKGLNPLWKRSEFAGLSLSQQKEKIRQGIDILKKHEIFPKFFFAPSHTFDLVTLQALEQESEIRYLSDTIGRKPYMIGNFFIVPQFGGHCRKMKIPGVWTFCFHPNIMGDVDFYNLENFLKKHSEEFISFDKINFNSIGKRDLFSKLLSWMYFTQRRIRGIK